jgi:hypothetical protein
MAETLNFPEKAGRRAERAFQFVSKRHTIDAMGKRTLDLYDRVFAQSA